MFSDTIIWSLQDIRLGEAWSVAFFLPSRQVGVYNIWVN